MQWDHSTNAGFSSAPKSELYIPQDESKDRPTAEEQMEDENSLRSEIKRLIAIRQAHPALQSRGEIRFVYARKNAYPLAYIRSAGEKKILVILNPSDQQVTFPCDCKLTDAVYTFGGEASSDGEQITVPGQSAGFYTVI